MKKGDYQIPFSTRTGNMLSYPEYEVTWVDNHEFEDTMTYHGYGRGRSSAVLYFIGTNGRKYSMFMSDFDDLMKSNIIVNGKATCKWTFTKKGANYGLKMCD